MTPGPKILTNLRFSAIAMMGSKMKQLIDAMKKRGAMPAPAWESEQFSLANCLAGDPQVKFVCVAAPTASPPAAPTFGYTVVKIDRN